MIAGGALQAGQELHPVMAYIGAIWPNFAAGKTPQQKRTMIAVWESALADIPVGLQKKAINEIVLRGTAFTSGNTKSCGCLSKEVKKARRLPDNRGVINHIILQYKRHARDRNLSWNLTYEQVEKIIQEPCFYCGTEKSNHKVTKNCKEGYDHNGIDRIDSSVGYEPNNVVSCCKICNYAKSNLTKDDFINWAIRVAEHSKAMAEQWG